MSKISWLHVWKESDNTTTRSNNEETTTEYYAAIANNATQLIEIWCWFGVSDCERKHLERYLVTHMPGRDDRWHTRRIDSPSTYLHENTTATKSRLEEIKEKTAKYPGLKKVMKCRIIAKKQRKHGKWSKIILII